MREYYGNIASSGIAVGKIKKLHKICLSINQYETTDSVQEKKRVQDAVCRVERNLKSLYEDTLQKVGKENADIFEMHRLMLNDKDYLTYINNSIDEKKEKAETAVWSAEKFFSDLFVQMQDEYMKARAIDIIDISQQLIEALTDSESDVYLEEQSIILVEELTPSQTMKLNKDMVLAFVAKNGSLNSHTAILARVLKIPAILGIDLELAEIEDGTLACVNGNSGAFIVNPDEKMIQTMKSMALIEENKREILHEQFGKDTGR